MRLKHVWRVFGVLFINIVLFIGIILFLNVNVSAATPIYVSPGGDDADCDGTTPDDYPGDINPGLEQCAVQTIQHGVDIVDVAGTVEVAVGNYTETITITKSLSLLGAQAGNIPTDINPRSGGESTIRPPASRPTDTILIKVTSDSVTINGFMLDGNNPSLVDCPFSSNGVCVHTTGAVGNGIFTPPFPGVKIYTPVNSLIVSHNIIKNFNYQGVAIDSNTGTPTSNNLITANVFDNMAGSAGYPVARRRAVWIAYNQYASVTNNKMTRVNDGISLASFSAANPGARATISGNEIACGFSCVWTITFFGTSSPFDVISNTITGGSSTGLALESMSTTDPVTVSKNIISGNGTGVYTFRDTKIVLSENTISNNTTGIYLNANARLVSAINNFINGNTGSGIQVATHGTFGDGIVGTIFGNDLSGNGAGLTSVTTATLDASGNWWGNPMVPISDTVDYTPWLNLGSDTDPGTLGFQGDFSSLTVDDLSTQTGAVGHINEGLDLVNTAGSVYISAGAYNESVTLDQLATLRGNGNFSLAGDLTIQQGIFLAPSGSMSMTGDFSLSGGTFAHNGGTVTLNGSSAQTIGGTASAIFSNLTISNTNGVSLGFDEQVTGTLTLNNTLFSLGSYDLTLGPDASPIQGTAFDSSNMIVADGTGKLCKDYDQTGSFAFPIGDITSGADYTPGSISFTNGIFNPGGQACINLVDGVHPEVVSASYPDYISRYWTITSSNILTFTADVTFNYIDPDDIVGDEDLLVTAKYDGTELQAGQRATTTTNTLSMSGIDSFSDFTALYNKEDPTAVTLASFNASSFDGSVLIEWETALELDILGYNIYRSTSPEGERELINLELIPNSPDGFFGASYEFRDTTVQPGATYYYWLEVVGIYGPESITGPIASTTYHYIYIPLTSR